jgi:16S rRNA U516 pseudouridylate synthase RsuA-like enzyme
MFISLGNEVTHLKRIAIGPWRLEDLWDKVFVEVTQTEWENKLIS